MSDCPDCVSVLECYDRYGETYTGKVYSARTGMDIHQEEAASRLEVSFKQVSIRHRLDDSPTLDPVHLNPLADVHHLDKRPFVGGDGVVHRGLVPDTFPVVCHRLFRIPSGVLNTCCQRATCDTGKRTHVGRGELDTADIGGNDIFLVTETLWAVIRILIQDTDC